MPITVPDQTIAAQVPEAPSAMTQIGQLLDLDNKRQQITSGKIKNTSDQANLDEEQGVRALMQNFDSYKGADGNVDMNKFVPDVLQAAPTKGAAIISGVVNAQRDGIAAKSALAQLSQTQKAQLAQEVGSYVGNGASVADNEKRFNAFTDTMPNARPIADYFHKYVMPQAGADQKTADAAYARVPLSVMSPTEQVTANTQNGIQVTNGQQSKYINTAPLAPGGIGATIEGNAQQAIPSVTTERTDPVTGQKSTVGILPPAPMPGLAPTVATREAMKIQPGAQQGMNAQSLQLLQEERGNENDPAKQKALDREILRVKMSMGQQQQAQTQAPASPSYSFSTSLPAGVSKNLENNVDEMNRHYSSLQDSSTGAQLQLGLTTNIRQLAKGAATGTLAGRQAFVAGMLNSFGIKATGEMQKDTDLLEKNMAQLNMSTPATTNAARELNAAGRPHGTMSENALVEAADQVSGQIKANMEIRNYLTPYKYANNGQGDSVGYQGARQIIEGIADPRAFQFRGAPPEGQDAMLKNLKTSDRQELRKKIEQLQNMGMLK